MAVAGLLAQYMSIKSQLSYVELQDTRWNNMATAMSKKLKEQETFEDKWQTAYNDADAACDDPDKSLKLNGEEILAKGDKDKKEAYGARVKNARFPRTNQVAFCSSFASLKVKQYDPDKLEEYTELDMEYSAMVAMYDTLKEELTAMADGTKQQLSTEAQDTHIVGGS